MNEYEKQADDFLRSTGAKITTEFKEFNSMDWDTDGAKRNIFKVTLANVNGREYVFDFGSSIADSCKERKVCKIDLEGEIEIYKGLAHKIDSKIAPYFSYEIKTTYAILREIDAGSKSAADLIDPELIVARFDAYRAAVLEYNKKNKYSLSKGWPTLINSPFKMDHLRDAVIMKIMDTIKELKTTFEVYNDLPADQVIHPTAYDILACLTKYDPGTFEDFCSEFGYDLDSRKAFKTYKSVRREWKNIELLFTDEQIEQLREIN